MNIYAKIVHDEGVVFEHRFETEKEVDAFVLGYKAALESLDLEPDDQFVCADDQPAKDEE